MFAIRRAICNSNCREIAIHDFATFTAWLQLHNLSTISKCRPLSSSNITSGFELLIQPRHVSSVAPTSHSIARAFSSSGPHESIPPDEDQLNKARFVRFFAAIFMLSAGMRVVPNVAATAVDHTIQLLEAEEEMLKSAGLSRLKMMLTLEAAQKRALQSQAIPKLMALVDSSSNAPDKNLSENQRKQ